MNILAVRFFMPVLLVALILSACGPGNPILPSTPSLSVHAATAGLTPTSSPSPQPLIGVNPAVLQGISIQVWHAFSGGAADLFTDQVAQFNAINQWGIIVTPTGFGDYTTLFEAVNSALETGEVPDLVAALPEQTLVWDKSAHIVDLSPYLADPAWNSGDPGIADFQSIFLAQDNLDGIQLGLPAQRSARFLFYNQTWAQELGFANPPATAEDFHQQACAANASYRADLSLQNDGYGGWIVDTDWQTTYSWLLAFGGTVSEGDSYGFSTDPNLAALQFLKSLFDDHCAWLSIEPTPFDSFARRSALFVSGDLAEASLANESMKRLNNTDEWTLLPFPGTEGRVLVTYGPSYSLLKSTPEKQLAAWLLARWLLENENQILWTKATGLFPLLKSMTAESGSTLVAFPQWAAAIADLPLAKGVPQIASWRKVRYVLEDGTRLIFLTDIHVDQIPSILTEMDSTAKELNDKYTE